MEAIQRLLARYESELQPHQAWFQLILSSNALWIELWDCLDDKYIDIVETRYCDDFEFETLETEILKLVDNYIRTRS
jgi:hypothetical protein